MIFLGLSALPGSGVGPLCDRQWNDGGDSAATGRDVGDLPANGGVVEHVRELCPQVSDAHLFGHEAWRRNEGDPGACWYACIDGKQRLTTMVMWWDNELAIPGEWLEERFVDRDAGALIYAEDLTPVGQRFMDNRFIIPVAEARLGSLAEEAEVYSLINSAGTAQTTDDLARAHAVARGR